MTLTFEPIDGGGYQAEGPHACYIVTRAPAGGWEALATTTNPWTVYGGPSYTLATSTPDGAMLACQRAENDGFAGWTPTGPDDATCRHCGDACKPGVGWCPKCWDGFGSGRCPYTADDPPSSPWLPQPPTPAATRIYRAACGLPDHGPECADCGDYLRLAGHGGTNAAGAEICKACRDANDPVCVDWTLTVLDEDGEQEWTGGGWEYLQNNPHDRARVMALGIGESFGNGGGAAPWYCVVRVPSRE